MLDRKTIKLILGDGKSYTFSERYKIDSDYYAIQERLRESKINFIQNNIKDKDDRLALLISQINKVYTPTEIAIYVATNYEEQYKACFNSFKILNEKISFDEFKKLIPISELSRITQVINELEAEVKKKEEAVN